MECRYADTKGANLNPNEEAKEKGFSMDDFLVQAQVIFRHFRLFTLCVCLVLACGLIYYCYARPLYRAISSAEVVFFEDKTLLPYERQYFGQRPGFYDFKEKLPTRTIAEKAAKRLGINMGYEGLRKNYINRVRVYLDRGEDNFNNTKLSIEVLSYDEEIVQNWARALVEEYQIHRKKERDTKANFLLEKGKQEREEAALDIANLKQRKLEVEQSYNYAELYTQYGRLQNLPYKISNTQSQIEEMDRVFADLTKPNLTRVQKFAIYNRIKVRPQIGSRVFEHPHTQQSNKSDNQKVTQSTTVVVGTPEEFVGPDAAFKPDDNWVQANQLWEEKEAELLILSKKLGPGHPERRKLEDEVRAADFEVEKKLKNRQKAFEFSYAQAVAQLKQLKDEYPNYLVVHKKLQTIRTELRNIDEKIKDQSRRHLRLHQQVERAARAYTNDPILEISYLGLKELSNGSISPNKGKLLVFCLGGALLLGISMAYLLEYMDSSVKAPENVEMELQIYGLGIVPELNAKGDVDLLQVHEAFPMFKESFRVIRTNLILRRDDMGRGQIIMLSSSMPQEGKSLCSLELARSFAELGDRTLLIDADLRRGKQTRKLTGNKVAGLADFLTGEAHVEPVQFEENLDFLPAGHYSNQAIENLGGQAFTYLIMGFRMQYSQIIVDGPPLLGLPDVFMMKDCIDGMVVVVSAGHTAFPQLRLAVEQVHKSRIPVHGFILNRVNFRTGGKYYRYYYRNYEYYHQGSEGQATVMPHAG